MRATKVLLYECPLCTVFKLELAVIFKFIQCNLTVRHPRTSMHPKDICRIAPIVISCINKMDNQDIQFWLEEHMDTIDTTIDILKEHVLFEPRSPERDQQLLYRFNIMKHALDELYAIIYTYPVSEYWIREYQHRVSDYTLLYTLTKDTMYQSE